MVVLNINQQVNQNQKEATMSKAAERLFTKAAFSMALKCPTRLYYSIDSRYANRDSGDEFLQALAEGGFQVSALAKVYYGIAPENDLSGIVDPPSALERTASLLSENEVVIAGAAFKFGNLFVRCDILRKIGSEIELVEVKAKSWNPETDKFFSENRKGLHRVNREICESIYEAAYQKFVVENAIPQFHVKSYLMLADKSVVADVDGINQSFKIRRDKDAILVETKPGAEALMRGRRVLTAFDVDEICDLVIAGCTAEQRVMLRGMKFVEFVDLVSGAYVSGTRLSSEVTQGCFKCPFVNDGDSSPELRSGFHECLKEKIGLNAADLKKPILKDLWCGGSPGLRAELLKRGKWFLKDLTREDLGECEDTDSGLNCVERKLVQVALMAGRTDMLSPELKANVRGGAYLDRAGLRDEMRNWKFPLHMIDFETTSVALPFYKGMRPYETVAFQFSHHVIESADGGRTYVIRHAGQYINTKKGVFPNYEFLRELKAQLEMDEGTVFRYSTHENTVLNRIREQLMESDELDRDELIEFIDSLTIRSGRENGGQRHEGCRAMVDLCAVVQRYYYDPRMKGSNSIKTVLPAVLNTSAYLKERYGKPIYGGEHGEIASMNLRGRPKAWVRIDAKGEVESPYKWLPDVGAYLSEDARLAIPETEEKSFCVNNGGAALTAYSKLQFADIGIDDALGKALLCYCELDTLAMVFIWEFFNHGVLHG